MTTVKPPIEPSEKITVPPYEGHFLDLRKDHDFSTVHEMGGPLFGGSADKGGPSKKRTASLETTIHNAIISRTPRGGKLSTVNKLAGPNVSSSQRLHCT